MWRARLLGVFFASAGFCSPPQIFHGVKKEVLIEGRKHLVFVSKAYNYQLLEQN